MKPVNQRVDVLLMLGWIIYFCEGAMKFGYVCYIDIILRVTQYNVILLVDNSGNSFHRIDFG